MSIRFKGYVLVLQWPFKWARDVRDDRDSRRAFTHTQQAHVWESQGGRCKICGQPLDLRTVVYHHVVPWSEGGLTIVENCIAVDPTCHQKMTFGQSLQRSERDRA